MSWIFWALGTLGFAGTVVFCVAAPTTAALAGVAIGKGITAALGKMVGSRPGCAVLAGAAVFLVTWIWRGDQVDGRWQAKWDAAQVSAERARQERDANIAKQLGDKYRPIIANLQSLNSTLRKQRDDYAKRKLVKAGGNKAVSLCRVGDDALRLRQPL